MQNKYILGLGFLVLLIATGCTTASPTGNVVCPQYECQLTTVMANFESKVEDAEGNGCLTDCAADIKVKNVEAQPTKVSVQANCWTTDKQFDAESETFWLQPGQEHTFKINLNVGLTENWKCDKFKIVSDKINGCQAMPK